MQQERSAAGSTRRGGIFARIVMVLAELLITAGVVVLLFVAWQLWWTNVAADARQRDAVREFARNLGIPARSAQPGTPEHGQPKVSEEPAPGATIGIMYVPRFGAEYTRPLVQGTTPAVLDALGIGHYEGTAMPGAVGNVAVAGHRQTHGAVLDNIDALIPGDRIYIQTRDGYYAYSFRNSEVVLPGRTDVLLPVPTQPAATPMERYLTMTSCNPRFGSEERIIAYSLLESWQPASAGPPPEIASQVHRAAGGA
ncbi:MAG: class E sortase [Arthrobacter sp.]